MVDPQVAVVSNGGTCVDRTLPAYKQ